MRSGGISWLPVIPKPARSIMLLKKKFWGKNDSLETRQPSPIAGNVPQRCVGPRREDPSRRTVAVKK
jgi:hypothetical protein